MAEEKKKGLFGFGSKPKEESTGAAHATAAAAANALHQTQSGQAAALGSKPTGTSGRTTSTNAAKPTASAAAVKPNAAKPTASAAAVKPTASASVKPTASAGSATAVKPTAVKPTAVTNSKFTDVPAGAYYAEAVEWAVKRGITSGTTDTTFNPTGPCHRGHVATFIWRSKGSPAPKTANSPYSDVTDGPFFKAILWAVENNIMEPATATTFNPKDPCTRAQVLTYLLRASGKPGATTADATAWATQKNLLAGQTGGTAAPCTRADVVTYLYRAQK